MPQRASADTSNAAETGVLQTLPAYPSAALTVACGVSPGDSLCFADELMLDDIYSLSPRARLQHLKVQMVGTCRLAITAGSAMGQAGATLHLDSCLTLMSDDGSSIEILVLVEVDVSGLAAEVYAVPLSTIEPGRRYTLIGIDSQNAWAKFGETACLSFTRGTRITLACGAQKPIEHLVAGDRILTRDNGPQTLRWIRRQTRRASGDLAPVIITAGTLQNEYDLLVSPEHQLFLSVASDSTDSASLQVRASHLLNGDNVLRRDSGHLDYFQMMFDAHQVVYAEGIAVETMMTDPISQYDLAANLDQPLPASAPRHVGDARPGPRRTFANALSRAASR